MPRISNDGSGSDDDDASSEYDSDSGSSVHTIYPTAGDASREGHAPTQASDYSNNFFAPQPSPTVPAPGRAIHGEKRKADDHDDQTELNGRATKTRRLSSPQSSSAETDSDASSEDENGYYDVDDDISPPPVAAVAAPAPARKSHAPVAQMYTGPKINDRLQTLHPPTLPRITGSILHNSNGLPKTGAQLWAEFYPHIKVSTKARCYLVSPLPAKRVPVVRESFRVYEGKPQNMASWLMHATGEELPPGEGCTRCAEGRGMFGPACVVMPAGDMQHLTKNTCANCWYNRQGFCCSVRWGNDKDMSYKKQKQKAYWTSRENSRRDAVTAAPVQGGTVHPAYASSENKDEEWEPFPGAAADQAPDDGEDQEFPATALGLLTSIGHAPPVPAAAEVAPPPRVKPSNSPPATVVLANSLDGMVVSWEKRYEGMDTAQLVEMQNVLVQRLEDTTMRMVAMQKVLGARQGGT